MLQLSLPACRSPILRHLFLNQFPLITRCMLEAYAAALIFFHSSYACILKWVNPLSSFVSVHTSFFFSLYLSLSSPSLSPFLFFSQSSLLITLSLLYFSDQLLFIFSFTCLTLYLSSHYLFLYLFFLFSHSLIRHLS